MRQTDTVCGRITPHSPDLDVIENLWDNLKQAVDAFLLFCMEEGSNMPSSKIQTLIKDYPRCLEVYLQMKLN